MNYDLVDDFGRRIHFSGTELVANSTDNGDKPQWTEITVYRTEAGKYLVWREFHYRMRHANPNCARLGDSEPVPATTDDTHSCNLCGRGNWAQPTRVKMDVYDTAEALIAGLVTTNVQTGQSHHSQFSQAILADVSEQDAAVRALWMEVRIP